MLAAVGLCIALVGCDDGMPIDGAGGSGDATSVEPATHTITDMAGREVTIPTHPTRVLGAANPDGMIIYSIDPQLMVGWVNGVSDRAKPYLTPEAAALPQVTSVSKWEDPNEEELLSLNLDFILVSVDLNNTDFSLYDTITADTGIPVVVIDADLLNWKNTYRFLASVFPDQAEQCYACAALAEEFTNDVTMTMARANKVTKVRVYYSTGDNGLQTCGDSNWNGAFVTPSGAVNVCDTTQTSGFAKVSMEQVLNWKPDMIISTASGDKAAIYSSADWVDVPAVINGEIYAAPQAPFSWVDKPTGINRIIGVLWTNWICYGDYATYDMNAAVKDFYHTFYHYDLTDAQVAELLDTKVELPGSVANAA